MTSHCWPHPEKFLVHIGLPVPWLTTLYVISLTHLSASILWAVISVAHLQHLPPPHWFFGYPSNFSWQNQSPTLCLYLSRWLFLYKITQSYWRLLFQFHDNKSQLVTWHCLASLLYSPSKLILLIFEKMTKCLPDSLPIFTPLTLKQLKTLPHTWENRSTVMNSLIFLPLIYCLTQIHTHGFCLFSYFREELCLFSVKGKILHLCFGFHSCLLKKFVPAGYPLSPTASFCPF